MKTGKSHVCRLAAVLLSLAMLTACATTPAKEPDASAPSTVTDGAESAGPTDNRLTSEIQTGAATTGTQNRSTVAPNVSATARTTGKTGAASTGSTAGRTAATTTKTTTTTKKEAPSVSDKPVELIGRFQQQGDSYRFAWSGSTITAGFEGTGIAVLLTVEGSVQKDYVNVSIDGGTPFMLTLRRGTERYVLKTGLPAGYHTVRVEKRTEGAQSTLRFSGFDYMGGKAAPAPARKTRRIELIGDSVTAGYGNVGEEGWTGYKMEEQDAGQTYGALAAAQLDAEAVILAVSGQGMYQNLGGQTSPVMRDFYDWTLPLDASSAARWAFETEPPDVVVINLGTNDYASNVEPQNFVQAYVQFISMIRSHYPSAFVICAVGPHSVGLRSLSAVGEVVDTVRKKGDSRVAMCVLALEPDEGLGGVDGHPSAKAHRLAAADLAACIRENLHW